MTCSKLPDEVQYAVEHLLRMASKHHFTVAAATISFSPLSVTLFQNTTENPEKLYQTIVDMIRTKSDTGSLVVEEITTALQ